MTLPDLACAFHGNHIRRNQFAEGGFAIPSSSNRGQNCGVITPCFRQEGIF
ncbi:MAG: hypothetical protein H7308_17755 [Chthonomonadaceae bacterium]|nr:hypothetical protein [Chthonomonadaceae bacterium]